MAKYGVTVWMKSYVEVEASSLEGAENIASENCFNDVEIDEFETELIEIDEELENELADRYWRDSPNFV